MSEAQAAKRPRLEQEIANGSSSTSPAGNGVSSPRRAARAVVDTDAELLEADSANSDAPVITDAMAAENEKCGTPFDSRSVPLEDTPPRFSSRALYTHVISSASHGTLWRAAPPATPPLLKLKISPPFKAHMWTEHPRVLNLGSMWTRDSPF